MLRVKLERSWKTTKSNKKCLLFVYIRYCFCFILQIFSTNYVNKNIYYPACFISLLLVVVAGQSKIPAAILCGRCRQPDCFLMALANCQKYLSPFSLLINFSSFEEKFSIFFKQKYMTMIKRNVGGPC